MVDKSLTLGTLFTANAAQFVKTVDLMKKKVGELNRTFTSVGAKGSKGMDGAAKSVNKLGAAMDKASNQTAKYKNQLGFVAQAFERLKYAAVLVAQFAAAAAALRAVTTGLREGVKEIVDYDQGLKNLQAITNATDAEVRSMGETIKDVARTTKFSTAEVAGGMTLLGQAGFTATESIQAMEANANLATGTLSSMQTTVDLMTTTIRAFGFSAVESGKASDILANAVNRSKLTIDKLRIAFNFIGAAAHQAGLTLEETAASAMTLANHGLRASTIGTGLRQVLSRLLSPTGKLREEFEANNIQLDKVNPSLVGFRTALQNLLPVLYKSADGTIDMAKAYRLFGLRGAQAAAIMTKAVASGDFDKMLEYTYETGSAARMAAKQIEGLGLKLKNLADRARLIAVALGEGGLTAAIGTFIDALKTLVTAIENFIRSDVGRIVTAWAGWTIVILSSAKALDLAYKSVLLFGKGITTLVTKMKAVIVGQLALNTALKGGKDAATGFTAAFGISLGPLLLIAAAIAGVVAAITLWIGAADRRIKKLEQEQSQLTTQVQTLGLYIKILDDLATKQAKGIDVAKEYARNIQRMKEESKAFIPVLREEVKFLALSKEQLEGVYSEKLNSAIQKQGELVKENAAQVESARIKSGLWNITVLAVTTSLTKLVDVVLKFGEVILRIVTFIPRMLGQFAQWVVKVADMTGAVSDFINGWKFGWNDAKASFKKWVLSYATESDGVVGKTEEVSQSILALAKLLDEKYQGKKTFEEIIAEIENLGVKVDKVTFDKIRVELKGITLALEKEQEEWKDNIDQLPVYFQEMYKDMDGLRKADFAKMVKSMQSELAAFEKTADQMGLKEEERASARSAIRARHLAKFAKDKEKEVKITEEAAEEELRYLEILEQGTKEMYDRRTAAIINHYLSQVQLAGGNSEKLIQLEKKLNADLIAEKKRLAIEMTDVDKQRQATTLQLEKQHVEEVIKVHTKMVESIKQELQGQYDKLKTQYAKYMDDIKDLDASQAETVRGIRQKTMTDEEKWESDRKEAHRLLSEGVVKGNVEAFKSATSLAAGLAREVQNESGDIVRSISDTSADAIRLVNKISTAHRKVLQSNAADTESQMFTLQDKIADLDAQVKQFATNIDALNRREMVIKADKTIAALGEVYTINNKFKNEWDKLEDKTITLTVKYNYVGKMGGTEGGTVEEGGGGGATSGANQTASESGVYRLGGVVKKLMAAGGKLAGYGGGDKVNAKLEPGEFVLRKEATKSIAKKYGGHVLDIANRTGSLDVVNSVGKRLGGIIGDTVKHFRSGGGVPSATMKANQNVFHLYLQPKYLTGDRQAMRIIANDFSKAIEAQANRWGRS